MILLDYTTTWQFYDYRQRYTPSVVPLNQSLPYSLSLDSNIDNSCINISVSLVSQKCIEVDSQGRLEAYPTKDLVNVLIMLILRHGLMKQIMISYRRRPFLSLRYDDFVLLTMIFLIFMVGSGIGYILINTMIDLINRIITLYKVALMGEDMFVSLSKFWDSEGIMGQAISEIRIDICYISKAFDQFVSIWSALVDVAGLNKGTHQFKDFEMFLWRLGGKFIRVIIQKGSNEIKLIPFPCPRSIYLHFL
jgi:hypothetical protein